MVWDGKNGSGSLTILGTTQRVEAGTPFAETVRVKAREAGLQSYVVTLNDDELESMSNCPEHFNDGDVVVVTKVDHSG